MLDSLNVRDWVYIQRSMEDTGLPGDIVERIGLVTAANEVGALIAFPNGYAVKGGPRGERDVYGSTVTREPLFIRYETKNKPYQLRRVKLLEPYEAGTVGRMVPTDALMERNDWRYGKCLALCESKWEKMWSDIEANGMRHPPMVSGTLNIHAGFSRVYAHHKAGVPFVECFVYDESEF